MGLLTLASNTAYARTSESQANIGTATTLGFRARVNGALLLNSAAASSVLVMVRGAAGATARLQIAVARAGGSVYVALTGSGGTNPQCVAIIAEGNFSAGAYYVLRGWASAGGCTMEVRNAAGSVIGTQSAAGVTVSNNNAANGFVWWGDTADLVGTTGAIDGAAVYSQEPPANVDTPHPDDAGILWGVLDDSGNIVPGATDLDDYSGATWGAGGAWHAPVEPIIVTPSRIATAFNIPQPSFTPGVATPVAVAPSRITGAAQVRTPRLVDSADVVWGGNGDSQTDQYRADANRGGGTPYEATTLGWLEQLASPALGQPYPATHHRGLDLGTWASTSLGEPRRRGFRNIWARDGATMSQGGINSQYVVSAQLPGLVSQIEDGDVTHAILGVTSNEWMNYTPLWGPNIYNGNGSTAGTGWTVSQVIASVVGDAVTWIDAVVEAGAIGVVVTGLFDFAKHPGIVELAGWDNATRRGYVTSTIDAINAQIAAHCAAVNVAEGRTVCSFRPIDEYLQAEVWPTADGQYVTMAGVQLDYLDSSGFSPYLMSIPGHAGTIMGGIYANTFIAAANELPGIYIEPFSDAEIRQNAGIYLEADTVSPNRITLAPSIPAPTLVQGAAVTPARIAATLDVREPSVEIAPNQVAPGRIAAAAEVHAPTVAITAGVVQPARVELPASVRAPAVLQPTRVAPSRIAAAVVTREPTVLEGVPAGIVRPTRITAAAAVREPVVQVSAATVAPTRISEALEIASPQVVPGLPGAVAVRPVRIGASATVGTTAVVEAVRVVVPERLAVATTVRTPALSVGSGPVALQPARIDTVLQVRAPRIGGEVVIHPDHQFAFDGAPQRTFTFERVR